VDESEERFNEKKYVYYDDEEFATAEETDLNDEDLNDDFSRKMSIRALNVATLHRPFAPGSIKEV